MRNLFLLDTNIVLHYTRKSAVYTSVETQFNFENSHFQPIVCIVTLGEIRAIAYRRMWGRPRLQLLDNLLKNLVAVDINSNQVIEAYAKISAHATTNGWALHRQKNDLWIAAVANVTGATLLTTDGDFSDAHDMFINRILYDNNTGKIIP